VLIKGSKRFILYPPAASSSLYPYGKQDQIHSNGVISYTSAPVRSDGLHPRHYAEQKIAALEDAMSTCSSKKRKKQLEQELEEANDALMTLMVDSGEDQEGDDFDVLMASLGNAGEKGEECEPTFVAGEASASEDEDEEEEGALFAPLPIANSGVVSPSEMEGEDRQPPSFSRIPSSVLHQHLGLSPTLPKTEDMLEQFPLLKEAVPRIVQLKAGEMLYLPASWW